MLRNIVHHTRQHAIAYLALTCALLALGGAAYAQLRIPPGAVGEVQIHNHVIDPVKWDTAYTTGFVRRWATFSATGALQSSSPGGTSENIGTGKYVVTWGDAFAPWCAPVATVIGGSATRTSRGTTGPTGPTGPTGTTGPSGPSGGAYVDARIFPRTGLSTLVALATYNSLGEPANEPVSLAVVCGPGAGSGQTFPTNLP